LAIAWARLSCAVEPEPRFVADRHLAHPAPDDEEGLGDHVGGVLAVLDPAQRVLQHRPAVVAVELGEADLRQLLPERLHLDLTGTHLPVYVQFGASVAGRD
jgi:hypothetical protein